MDDEGGVLGNLPRSRPGKRSEKRSAPGSEAPARAGEGGGATRAAKTTARAAETAERRSAKAARASGQASGRPEPPRDRPSEPERPSEGGPDPVGDAVRLAAGVAGLGFKLANGVTREVLRRLPRP